MPAKKKGIGKIIPWGVYPFDLLVSTESDEDLVKRITKTGYILDSAEVEDLRMCGKGRTIMLKCGATIIRLSEPPRDAESIGTLSHEVFHVVFFLFRRVNIKLCKKSDEAFAYAIGYMFQSTSLYRRETNMEALLWFDSFKQTEKSSFTGKKLNCLQVTSYCPLCTDTCPSKPISPI